MKVTLKYLRKICDDMEAKKIVPLPVYIVVVGDKRFMCPALSMPECLALSPFEIVAAKFPVEAKVATKAMIGQYALNPQYTRKPTTKRSENASDV